ncbi:MAG: cysteine--tRNA ligase [Alphaproteobacteria bacterium]
MELQLYNSLSRTKERFVPLDPKRVGLYVCGPTVYDFAHLGNARPVVVFDVLHRLLQHQYPAPAAVHYVRNITDVDDKINAAALANGEPIQALTTRTTQAFHEDMAALGALPPSAEPRATEHIADMIQMIEALIAKGHAYAAEGHVLFAVSTFAPYGTLSGRQRSDMIAGARVEVAPYKRDPADFVLWKPSDDKTPGWESPWGYGRPGWHIECSAMSAHYLGPRFDIHGGGIDLIFPHHENELAQSRCAHGTETMARYWMHNGHLTVGGEKMAKSEGNFVTVRDLLKRYPGETLRLALLMTHYRQPLDWSENTLVQAGKTLDRLYTALRGQESEARVQASEDILDALCDDLNTPLAIARLHELANAANGTNDPGLRVSIAASLRASASFLGILQQDPQLWAQQGSSLTPQTIEELIAERNQARAAKDFARSDEIRQHLLENSIVLEDSAQGTTWRHLSSTPTRH